tara:strand:- start:254 stop:883 length:630 start_codon:yes stop_codon:yes gene_type:complete
MTNIKHLEIFDDLSEKHSTWIIKYCSTTFPKSIFMIWYRDNDENETENILSYKNGEIFAANTLIELKERLKLENNELIKSENINQWLENTKEVKIIESSTYDLISIVTNIKNNILDEKTIEGFADFINLFDDFINQDEKNNYLQVYFDDEIIKKTWDYYYEFIFWPKFKDKEKFKLWYQPKLEIDMEELLSKFEAVVHEFEKKIKNDRY